MNKTQTELMERVRSKNQRGVLSGAPMNYDGHGYYKKREADAWEKLVQGGHVLIVCTRFNGSGWVTLGMLADPEFSKQVEAWTQDKILAVEKQQRDLEEQMYHHRVVLEEIKRLNTQASP